MPKKRETIIGNTVGGRFEVLKLLGAGGIGEVYLAEHRELKSPFAVKVLRRDLVSDDEVVARFRREAMAASRIQHRNIVYITDFGQLDDGRLYLVMEYLEGESLQDLLDRDRPMDLERALKILLQVCDALRCAHDYGVVHRDLKPDNIMLTNPPGRRDVVKLIDFGLAKLLDSSAKRLTADGAIFGTPHHMSPEQTQGLPVDHRTDIYAFGTVLYECLTKSPPFEAESIHELLVAHREKIAEPPSSHLPEGAITPELDALVMRCLEKKPQDRYSCFELLMGDLAHCERLYLSEIQDREADLLADGHAWTTAPVERGPWSATRAPGAPDAAPHGGGDGAAWPEGRRGEREQQRQWRLMGEDTKGAAQREGAHPDLLATSPSSPSSPPALDSTTEAQGFARSVAGDEIEGEKEAQDGELAGGSSHRRTSRASRPGTGRGHKQDSVLVPGRAWTPRRRDSALYEAQAQAQAQAEAEAQAQESWDQEVSGTCDGDVEETGGFQATEGVEGEEPTDLDYEALRRGPFVSPETGQARASKPSGDCPGFSGVYPGFYEETDTSRWEPDPSAQTLQASAQVRAPSAPVRAPAAQALNPSADTSSQGAKRQRRGRSSVRGLSGEYSMRPQPRRESLQTGQGAAARPRKRRRPAPPTEQMKPVRQERRRTSSLWWHDERVLRLLQDIGNELREERLAPPEILEVLVGIYDQEERLLAAGTRAALEEDRFREMEDSYRQRLGRLRRAVIELNLEKSLLMDSGPTRDKDKKRIRDLDYQVQILERRLHELEKEERLWLAALDGDVAKLNDEVGHLQKELLSRYHRLLTLVEEARPEVEDPTLLGRYDYLDELMRGQA